jgi:flagellar protein FliO/FliZ
METVSIARFVFSFLIVLGLIGLFALALRRWPVLRGMATTVTTSSHRLKIIEQRAIDVRNKLVLVQRDDVQHLLLVSGEQATVVESNIAPRKVSEVSDAA